MEQKSIPKFYGLRIYLSSILLYFFLVLPFIGFIIFQNVPAFIENRAGGMEQVAATADSLIGAFDSIPEFTEEELDNLVDLAIQVDIDTFFVAFLKLQLGDGTSHFSSITWLTASGVEPAGHQKKTSCGTRDATAFHDSQTVD